MDKLLKQYYDTFNESFPVEDFPGTHEELEQTLRKCLESGVTFSPDYIGKDDLV